MSPLPPDFREWTCSDVLSNPEFTQWVQQSDPDLYDFCLAELEHLRSLKSVQLGIAIGCAAAGLGYLLFVLYQWYKDRRDSLPPRGSTRRVWLHFDVAYLNPFPRASRVPAPVAAPVDVQSSLGSSSGFTLEGSSRRSSICSITPPASSTNVSVGSANQPELAGGLRDETSLEPLSEPRNALTRPLAVVTKVPGVRASIDSGTGSSNVMNGLLSLKVQPLAAPTDSNWWLLLIYYIV